MEQDLDQIEQATARLYRSAAKHKNWESLLKSTGLHLDRTSANILQMLADPACSECRQQEVAERIGIDAPTITRKIQRLVLDGLVVKQADASDARATHLVLTVQGQEAAKRIKAAKRQLLTEIVEDWSAYDRKELIRLLNQFADSNEKIIAKKQSTK